MLRQNPQPENSTPENILGAIEVYLNDYNYSNEAKAEEEAVKSILEKTRRSALTEEEAIERILEKTRGKQDKENLKTAIEKIHTSKELLNGYKKISKDELVKIAHELNEAKIALGNTLFLDRLLISKFQKELNAKVDRIFCEIADNLLGQLSGNGENTEIKPGEIFLKETIRSLKEMEENIEFISEIHEPDSETQTS